MMLRCDATAQVRIVGDIDAVSETEESIVFGPFRCSDRFSLGLLEFLGSLHNCVLLLFCTVSASDITEYITFLSFW
jgi:hypothetical protein